VDKKLGGKYANCGIYSNITEGRVVCGLEDVEDMRFACDRLNGLDPSHCPTKPPSSVQPQLRSLTRKATGLKNNSIF
jgi:hypothetical protein